MKLFKNLNVKRYFIFVFILLSVFSARSQVKTLRGIVLNEINMERVEGAKVGPSISESFEITDKKGKFRIRLPNDYYDTIVIAHPAYYSQIIKVKKGLIKPKPIKFFVKPLSMKIDSLFYEAFDENKLITGRASDPFATIDLTGVSISLPNGLVVGESGNSGRFWVAVPDETDSLIFTHMDYFATSIKLKDGSDEYINLGFVELRKRKMTLEDTVWSNYRNSLSVAVNEIVNGGIALRYQRYFGNNQSLGLYATYYLGFGIELIGVQKMSFDGYKVSLAYRRFTDRKLKKGLYGEARISGGYFNFGDLYSGSAFDGVSPPDEFLNMGIGIGGGFFTKLAKLKRGFLNFYLGLQYFPIYHQEKSFWEHDEKHASVSNYGYWYSHGPGSIVEIKIAFGGLF